jgi:magnesium-protoporphyrin O-methyltransferase
VGDCCDPAAYREEFDEKGAARRLRTYRRRGLDPMASKLVAFLVDLDITGKTVLEVGGGVGDLQVELLKAGASSGVNVELSDAYEPAAATLLAEEGLTGRVERRLGDFVGLAGLVSPADIVVLNRVICCYPFMDRMVDAATAKARSLMAISIPRDGFLGHVFIGLDRARGLVRGGGFRAYLHPIAAVEARAAEAGMRVVHVERSLVWQGMVFARA